MLIKQISVFVENKPGRLADIDVYKRQTFAYTPILVLSGVFMGWITSTILFALLPFLKRIASLL